MSQEIFDRMKRDAKYVEEKLTLLEEVIENNPKPICKMGVDLKDVLKLENLLDELKQSLTESNLEIENDIFEFESCVESISKGLDEIDKFFNWKTEPETFETENTDKKSNIIFNIIDATALSDLNGSLMFENQEESVSSNDSTNKDLSFTGNEKIIDRMLNFPNENVCDTKDLDESLELELPPEIKLSDTYYKLQSELSNN